MAHSLRVLFARPGYGTVPLRGTNFCLQGDQRVAEPPSRRTRRERDIKRDRVFSAHSLRRLRVDTIPAIGMLLTATDNASGDSMYKQRLERFYRDHPGGLGDSPPNNAEVITAAASATRHEADGLGEKKCIQDPGQVGVNV
jgi:hypothetical protein